MFFAILTEIAINALQIIFQDERQEAASFLDKGPRDSPSQVTLAVVSKQKGQKCPT